MLLNKSNKISGAGYEGRVAESEAALRPKLTPEVLAVTRAAVRACGHMVDLVESAAFVGWCHGVAGVESPEDLEIEMDDVSDVLRSSILIL